MLLNHGSSCKQAHSSKNSREYLYPQIESRSKADCRQMEDKKLGEPVVINDKIPDFLSTPFFLLIWEKDDLALPESITRIF